MSIQCIEPLHTIRVCLIMYLCISDIEFLPLTKTVMFVLSSRQRTSGSRHLNTAIMPAIIYSFRPLWWVLFNSMAAICKCYFKALSKITHGLQASYLRKGIFKNLTKSRQIVTSKLSYRFWKRPICLKRGTSKLTVKSMWCNKEELKPNEISFWQMYSGNCNAGGFVSMVDMK